MGCKDSFLSGKLEPSVRDHSPRAKALKLLLESGQLTVPGGEFVWGGRLNNLLDWGAFFEREKANSAIC